METFFIENLDGSQTEWVKIENLDDSFTWMPKSEYDRQQAEQSTPIESAE
jgi:hypothetical protein